MCSIYACRAVKSSMAFVRCVWVAVLVSMCHVVFAQEPVITPPTTAPPTVTPPPPHPRPGSGCAENEWKTALGKSCNACPFFSTSPPGTDYFTLCQCDSGKYLADLVDTNMTCSGGCGCAASTSVLHGQIHDGPRPLHKNCDWLVSSNAVINLQFFSVDITQDYQHIYVRGCATPSCVTSVLYATITGTHGTNIASTVFQTDRAHPFLKVEFISMSMIESDGFEAHWWTSGDTDAYACYEEPPALPAPPPPAPPGVLCPAGTDKTVLYEDGWLGQYYDYAYTMKSGHYVGFSALTPFHVTTSATIDYEERWHWPWNNGEYGDRDNWGARWTGFIHIVTAGSYNFELESDDGSWMWLNGVLFIENGGEHGMEKKSSRIDLQPGHHSVRFHYYNHAGGAGMIARYDRGDLGWALLPGVTIHGGVCNACSPGYYKADHDDTPCLPCPKGRYSANSSSYVCAFCPAGKVAINIGSVTCTACGEGSHSIVIDGIWGEFCRCNAGFSKTPAGPCARCVAGKYKTVVGDGACSDCASDTYSQGLGATSSSTCTSCPHTTTSLEGSVTCRCRAGYTGSDGTVSCAACEPAKYKGNIGSASCTPCPDFSSSNITGALSNSVCVCVPGTALGSTGTCTKCGPGRYRHASSGPACIACETGTYSPDLGAVSRASCVPCPTNMVSPAGSGLLTDCSCKAGYWGWEATYPSCRVCAEGKYKDFVGEAMWCHSCPQNKHTLLRGSATPSSCTCNQGYTGPLGLDECAPCSSADVAGLVPTALSQCALCGPGYYTGSGAHLFQRCASCQPDYQRVYAETNVCTQCPGCTLIVGSCPANHWRSFEQSTCEPCPGVYVAPAGSTAETDCTYDRNIWCPANQWQAFAETEQRTRLFERCGPCPPYSSAPKGTKFISACACDNKVDVAAGVIASVTCSGGCECTGSSSAVQGYITDGPGDQSVKSNCKWLFASNAKIHLKFLTFHHPGDFITINLCMTALCDKDRQLIIATDFMRSHLGLSTFETTTDYPFLQVIFTSGPRTGVGFRAEWFTSGPAYSCMQCGMGQYSAVNASTRQDECVSCVAGKYSQVTGGATSAVCTSCPSGMYSSTVGATVCRSCAPGQRSRTDRMGCVMLGAPPACSEAVNASVSCAHSACECIPTSDTASGFVSDGPLWSQPGSCSWTISAQIATSVISVRFPQFWIALHHEHVKLFQCSDASCTSRQQIISLDGMREPMHLKSILSPNTMPDRTDVVYTSTTGHLQVVAHLFYQGEYPGFVAAWSARMPECDCAAGFTGACSPCGPGTYKTGTGNAACTRCVAGKNSLQEAATSPLVCNCDAGSTGNDGLAACTLCEPGTYKARSGSAPCTDCPAGSHSTATGDVWGQACACNAGFSGAHPASCVRCVAGQYKSWVGFGYCTDCSAGHFSEEVGATGIHTCATCASTRTSRAGSASPLACVCPMGLSGAAAPQVCTACQYGKFKPEEGNDACSACPANSHHTQTAATSVLACTCNAGSIGPPGTACTLCAAGTYTYRDVYPQTDYCFQCQASTYSTVVGSTSFTSCQLCPHSKTSAWGQSSVLSCVCPGGETGPDGDHECTGCARGKYKALTGSHACNTCATGRYTEGTGNNFVQACKCYSGYTGLVHPHVCLQCAMGKYKQGFAPTHCLECSPGKIGTSLGLAACHDCPHGRMLTDNTTSGLNRFDYCACPLGTTGRNGNEVCEPCATGTYKANIGTHLPCVSCVPGKSTNTTGALSIAACACSAGSTGADGGAECSPCGPSTYKPGLGSVLCTRCPPDKSSTAVGARTDADCKCDPGFTGADGAQTCSQCAPGEHKSAPGNATCQHCAHSKYAASPGAVHCTSCPGGKSSTTHGATSHAECVCGAGSTGADGGAACSPCSQGRYKAAQGSAVCTQCVPGKWTASAGASSDSACTCDAGSTGSDGLSPCVLCAAGTFKALPGPQNCSTCINSRDSHPGATICVCKAGHAPTGLACDPCVAGKYKPSLGAHACTACAAGQHSNAVGASADPCENCQAGTYAADYRTRCVSCVANWHSEEGSDNSSSCVCNAGHTSQLTLCPACEAGKYKDTLGAHACTPCAAGKHSGTVGASADPCETCRAGTHAADDRTRCLECVDGSHSEAESDHSSSCVCNAGHTSEDTLCPSCVPGKYKPGAGAHPCTACAAGKHSNAVGASADPCANCPAGSYAADFRTRCLSCVTGAHSEEGSDAASNCFCKAGHTSELALCPACVPGKYKPGAGAHACTPCAAGKHSNAVGASADPCTECAPGSYSADDGTQCVQCHNNSHSPPKSASMADCVCNAGHASAGPVCAACEAGKYKDSAGAPPCTPCAAGKHSSTVGASADPCENCQAGTYAADLRTRCASCVDGSHSEQGSEDPSSCLCNAGHTSQLNMCPACEAGKYKDTPGAHACTPCPAGKHSNAVGASADPCTACAPGSYSADDRSQCVLCHNNSHSEEGSGSLADCVCSAGHTSEHTLCAACVPGKFKSQPGSGACTACAPGKFSGNVGAVANTCTNCLAGSYAAVDRSLCLPCPPYSFSAERSTDATDCACNAGWSRNDEACVGCAAGKYKLHAGPQPCIACDAGKVSDTLNSSTYMCTDCAAGSYASVDKSQCVPCRADSHSSVQSDDPSRCLCNAGWSDVGAVCVGCVAGKYKTRSGPLACTDCAPGKYLPSVNASTDRCTDCPPGSFSAADKSACLPCKADSSAPAGSNASTDCVCDPGRSGETCEPCAAGKYTTLGAPCQNCEQGKFSPAPGAAACAACPPGSSNAVPASTACICEPGFTGEACVSCPEDSYKSETGAHACTSCPAASFVAFPDNTVLSDCICQAGKYLREIPDTIFATRV